MGVPGISEVDGFEVVSAEPSASIPATRQLPMAPKRNPAVVPGVDLPEGIRDVDHWGSILCVLPKVKSADKTYCEMVQDAQKDVEVHNYLCWIFSAGMSSAKVKDFQAYLKAIQWTAGHVHASKDAVVYYPNSTEKRIVRNE